MMTPGDLAQVLRKTPPARLKIFALARELRPKRGRIPTEAAIARAQEIAEASQEVEAYTSPMRDLLWRLKQLAPPRP